LVLLLAAMAHVFLARKTAEPPKWMGKLRAVTVGEEESQVTGCPPRQPRPAKQHWTGFEPLTPYGCRGPAVLANEARRR
jgi:hypothetical protein